MSEEDDFTEGPARILPQAEGPGFAPGHVHLQAKEALLPGQILARGVARHLRRLGFATVEELVPAPGLRVDLMALGPRGEIWIVECKSSRADFLSDHKWQGYTEFADRFFWAVDADFPLDLLPPDSGVILADGYDAEIRCMAGEQKLSAARRKSMTALFARHAAFRLQLLRDPGALAEG